MRYRPQYTILGSPTMNDVVERWNRTLKDIVRSIICHFILPEPLRKETLNTAAYIVNRIPTKTTIKIPYEFWTQKFNLKYLHIWGCPTKVRHL